MHPNKAIVAVAAKIARIAWVIITNPSALYERRDPASRENHLVQIARPESLMTKQWIGAA